MASELKEKTAKGLLWGGLSNGMMQIMNFLFGIVLGRILSDSEYGMIGLLTIFSAIAATLQESGFSAGLTNKKEIRHEDYNAVFWFSISVSVTIYILLFFCAPFIASFFRNDDLIPLSRFVFLSFVISSTGTAHNAYLYKHMMVKQKAISTLIALFVSGCIGIIMAINDFSYWSIATQNLVYITISTLCFWYFSKWRPSFRFDFSPLQELFAFSSKILITNIFNQINNNIFSLILGRFYSEKEVGQYNQANKWNQMGHSLITGMINGVAQPMLTQVGNDKQRLQRTFRKMLRFTAFISCPVMFGISLIAPEIITITITSKWLPSAHILRILAIGGAFLPITSLYINFLISRGKSNIFMWNTIILGCIQLLALLLLTPYGITTMISVYICINIGWLFIWHHFLKKEIDLPLVAALKDTFPYVGLAASTMLLTYFLTQSIANLYLLITAKIILAACIYTALMVVFGSATFKECLQYILNRGKITRS